MQASENQWKSVLTSDLPWICDSDVTDYKKTLAQTYIFTYFYNNASLPNDDLCKRLRHQKQKQSQQLRFTQRGGVMFADVFVERC